MKRKTEATFPTCRDYERHLRKGGQIYDYVIIGRTLFTMDEYDYEGKYITYGNKKKGRMLRIDTKNRYETKKDAEVSMHCYFFERVNFPYAE